MTASDVVAAVAHEHGVRISDIRGRKRDPFLVRLRVNIAKQLRGETWRMSFPEIGRVLGRHHTTIIHYLRGATTLAGHPGP